MANVGRAHLCEYTPRHVDDNSINGRGGDEGAYAVDVLSVPKIAVPPLNWMPKPNHAGSVVCASVLFDTNEVAIPGLTMALEAKAPIVTDQCLFLFSLFQQGPGGRKFRRYQLEVCPKGKLSHSELTRQIFGPHEHVEELTHPITDAGVDCTDWQYCYEWFKQRCNLVVPDMESPC